MPVSRGFLIMLAIALPFSALLWGGVIYIFAAGLRAVFA